MIDPDSASGTSPKLSFVRLTEWSLDKDKWFHIYPTSNPTTITENEGLDPITVKFQQKRREGGVDYTPSFILAVFRKQTSDAIVFVKLNATDGSVVENVVNNEYLNGATDMTTFRH
jgi:hypothetical protein